VTAAVDRLLAIMARLRHEEHGCPWDREQDFATIAPYTIEEAYEVADAIARADTAALKDELGDLLFQVAFHARIAEEAGLFDFDDVATAIADKMIRRHPHVFGDVEIPPERPPRVRASRGPRTGSGPAGRGSAAAQTAAWEAHKVKERAAHAAAAGIAASLLDGVALALPALLRAAKIQGRAARIGFDWSQPRPVIAKLIEEIGELEAELDRGADPARIADEIGDLLFAAANLSRKLEIDPEAALRGATAKFERRFRRIEAIAAERGASGDLDALEALWQEVKRAEGRGG
jgi:nucleoside triphosphate diphosphatase